MNLIPMTIHTLGPAGTFTEEIALRVANEDTVNLHTSIQKTIHALDAGGIAVLPIHNSAATTQPETITLLSQGENPLWKQLVHPVQCIGKEIIMAAGCHTKAKKRRSRMKSVITKNVAFDQCRPWLQANHPNATLQASDSTIAGAQEIIKYRLLNAIALGSKEKLEELGLHILDPNVNKDDNGKNPITLFAVLQR